MGRAFSLILQIVFFFLSAGLVFCIAFLLGYPYLLGDSLPGNDTFSFYVIADWINKFYPRIPFWFPLQGAGVSFTGYPWFAAYLINIISHTFPVNLVQSFRILGFISVPITAVGIFVFCWTRLTEVKYVVVRQVIGFFAALFMVSAPASWVWLTRWGFYAEQVSIIFLPWIAIFLDLFLQKVFEKKYDFYFRLSILGAVVFCVLGFMTHFYIVLSTMLLFTVLYFARFISQKDNKLIVLKSTFVPVALFLVVLGLGFSFRYYSYSRYTKAVAEGGLRGSADVAGDRAGTSESILTPKMMLSLEDVSSEKLLKPRDLIVDMRFPFYVWILLVPVLILGFFKSKRLFLFAILGVTGFVVNTNIDAYIFFSKFPVLGSIPLINQLPIAFLGRLFFVTGRFVIPVAAAYGAFIVWETFIPSKVKFIKALISVIAGIGVIVFVFWKFNNLPYPAGKVNVGTYGKVVLKDIWGTTRRAEAIYSMEYTESEQAFLNSHPEYSEHVDIIYLKYLCAFDGPAKPTTKTYDSSHICSKYPNPDAFLFSPSVEEISEKRNECNNLTWSQLLEESNKHCRPFYRKNIVDQLKFDSWPKISVSGDIGAEIEGTRKFFEGLPDGKYRYDISGFAARTIMSTPLVNNNSQLQVYINSLSLLYNLSNYSTQIMYSNFPLYQKPGVLSEVAKWYGIKYVYLSGTPLEPQNYWKEDSNWTKLTGKEDEGWRSFAGETSEINWDSRPKILVIADNSKNFYDETFKFFTRGALKFEQAIPVSGGGNVDEYSSQELSQYDVIFMRAYTYGNKQKAYRLLDNYIKSGGNLIFDTGWQYFVPDYQLEKSPDFMPFEKLTWVSPRRESKIELTDPEIADGIVADKLGDLNYGDMSWGISSPQGIKDWAKVQAKTDDHPIIVSGNYGKGKVTWLGFNIVPHSESKDSLEEVLLFNKLMTSMVGDGTSYKNMKVEEYRPGPDKVELKFSENSDSESQIIFKEAYYPDWKAKLVSSAGSKQLKVTKAGPGFLMMNLPKITAGDKVVLEIKPSIGQILANILSALTFIALSVYVVYPKILPKMEFKTPKIHIKKSMFSSKNEDVDY